MQYTPSEMSYPEMKINGEKKYDFGDKYNTLGPKTSYDPPYTSESKFNTIGPSRNYSYDEDKNGKLNGFDTSPHVTQSSAFLGVDQTPTPTSSIETEDSVTREVGERDIEGDGEQSE